MVEVFKTDVIHHDVADRLIDQIHRTFIGYKANFDLQDCDNILRIKSVTGSVESTHIIYLLKKLGCNAEILEDEVISLL
ncbi:MAG: hypothetical protein ABI416_10890 [Ginsengibacter sp.]